MKYKCEYCGKEFERNLSEFKKAKRHYCSRLCKNKAQKQKNNYILENGYVKILCKSNGMILEVLLDPEDYEKCEKLGYKITVYKKIKDTTYYAKIKGLSLHRFIMNCPKDKIIDHKNHNGLDNRKCNLRICTYKENNRNRITKSGHTGVYWNKKMNKWKAELEINHKSHFGGYFNDINEAIQARKKLEQKFWANI